VSPDLDHAQVLDKVRTHLADELGVARDSITPETHFRDDLDADSLDLYELVMELEDTYGVKMTEEEAAGIETVGQAVDFVLARLPA
jgi:acyl carrier protein